MKSIQINDSFNYLRYFDELRNAFVNSSKAENIKYSDICFEILLGLNYYAYDINMVNGV